MSPVVQQGVAACPADAVLRRFLDADATTEGVREHVDGCPACHRRLEVLSADPDLAALLGPPDGPSVSAPTPLPAGAETVDLSGVLRPAEGGDELGRLGGYRVLRVLGRGGMGVVCLAEDTHLRRPVALKLIRPGLAVDPRAAAWFLREARALAALAHENVVTVHQVGQDGPTLFLAMEYLRGETVADWADRVPRRPLGEVLRVVREAAEGLAYAHARGVVHRDLKPANLWRAADRGRVKLIDFGLARDPSGETLTRAGELCGTPAYMAPEQARGAPADTRSDLFALGVVLYELCAGASPFARPRAGEALAAVAGYDPPPLDSAHPWLPAGLVRLVRQLLAKDPPARPADTSEVVRTLRLLEDEVARRRLSDRPVGAPEPATPAPSRRSRRWAVAVGVLLAGAVAVAAAQYVEIRDKNGKVVAKHPVPPGGSVHVLPGDPDGKAGDGPKAGASPDGGAPTGPGDPPPRKPNTTDGQPGTGLPSVPTAVKPGEPVGPLALTRTPAALPGVRTWTLETVRPRKPVTAVAYHPRGELLAAGGEDGTVRLYDARTGRLVKALIGMIGRSTGGERADYLAWSPDGKRLLVSSHRSGTAVWDVDTGARAYDSRLVSFALAADGESLLGMTDPTPAAELVVVETRAWAVRGRLGNARAFDAGAWHPGGRVVAVGLGGGVVRLYDAEGRSVGNLDDGSDRLEAVAFSPDGKRTAVAGHFGPSHAVRVRTGQAWAELSRGAPNQRGPIGLAWSPDGSALAVWHAPPNAVVRVYAAADLTGRPVELPQASTGAAAWSPDGKALAVGVASDPSSPDALRVIDRAGKVLLAVGRDPGLEYTSDGHYRDPKAGRAEVVYVVQTDAGQETLTPAEFEKRHGWKNDPSRVFVPGD